MLESLKISPQLLIVLGGCLVLFVTLVLVGRVPVSYNIRNLLVRWRITLLTALAFTLVVSLLTVMLAFVNGMTRLTDSSGQPGNVMILSDGATDELFSNLAKSDTTNVERQSGVEQALLRDESGEERAYPLCSKEVYIVVNQQVVPPPLQDAAQQDSGKVKAISAAAGELTLRHEDGSETEYRMSEEAKVQMRRVKVDDLVNLAFEVRGQERIITQAGVASKRRFVQLRGIEDHRVSSLVHDMKLMPGGKWWGGAGVQDASKEEAARGTLPLVQAVLGEGAARVLGQDKQKPSLEVGDTFELGPRKWIVTGIMASAGSTFGSEIWAKQSVVGPMFGKDQFTCLVVRTKDNEAAKKFAEFMVKEYKPAVRAETELEYYSKLSETNRQFSIAIYFVTIIMAVGGIFGVMNTMFAAIAQRTKDIGVLRILGFARWQILVSFFLETLFIAIVGGVVGCAIGMVFDGASATSIVSSGQGGGKTVVLKLIVDANILFIGILFTLIMGALGGLVPSLSAMRLRPLESLR